MILAFMTDPLWLALAAAFTLFRALTSKRATPLDGRDGLLHTGPMQAIPDGYGTLPDTPIDYWPSLYGPARQQQQHGADLADAIKLAGHAGRGL